ncbi:hypothetical protein [Kutzneria sp. NPDC051319]|uniref:hypothetical protein n=1 Tax=Kutzneria sp. NPDC051319 TaxID=3155047 RepID=UPI003429375E
MTREKHYRRLLALYPSDHRRQHGEEMLGVLLAAHGGWRDDLDLVRGAAALHLRRTFNMDGGLRRRDVLAIISLLGPIVTLTGAVTNLHEIVWWIFRAGSLSDMPLEQVPDAPVWGIWLVVAILALLGLRRAAAVSAWLAVAAYVVIMPLVAGSQAWHFEANGLSLLGVFAAVALTWSPGPRRGKELVGRRGILLAIATVAAAALVIAMTPSLYWVSVLAWEAGPWLAIGAMALGPYLACRGVTDRRVGRRATLVLALPTVTYLLQEVLAAIVGPPLYWIATIPWFLFYGVPALIVLAGFGILRPITAARAS